LNENKRTQFFLGNKILSTDTETCPVDEEDELMQEEVQNDENVMKTKVLINAKQEEAAGVILSETTAGSESTYGTVIPAPESLYPDSLGPMLM
jgi:hypothetical protein